MPSELPITQEQRVRIKKALQNDLADATRLVWLLQNGISEGVPLPELVADAWRLKNRIEAILGDISRWELMERA